MKKLTIHEKKKINGGASSLMGIATGILTITSLTNLIIDLFKRYVSRNNEVSPDNSYENFFNSNNSEYFVSPKNFQKNKITLF